MLTATGGAYNESTFALNNLFNVAGGVNPVGFTKYMAFYSKAWCLGARIKVKGAISAPSAVAPLVCGLTITTNATTLASAESAIDNGMCDWVVMAVNPDRFQLSESVDVAKFMNKPRVLDDPQFFSTIAAGPGQLVVAHLWSQGIGAVTTILGFIVEIEFDVVFTDPVPFT
jgi:hypothetical protein